MTFGGLSPEGAPSGEMLQGRGPGGRAWICPQATGCTEAFDQVAAID